MSTTKNISRLVLLIFVLVLLIGIGTRMALAGQSDNSEVGQEIPIGGILRNNDEAVTGADTRQQSGDFKTNGEGHQEINNSTFIEEEVELIKSPDSPYAQFFKRSAGSNFQPRDSAAVFSYGGLGCLRRDSPVGDPWFTIDLQVPDGAIIDFLRVYFRDFSNNYNINSELWAFDGVGGATQIAEADSSGAPGYGSAGSGPFTHTVDNKSESLVLIASIEGGVGSALELCGTRIRYQYTLLSANFLPAMMNLTAP